MERIVLSTGGTGGHIFPALAVGEAIKKNYPEANILFIGANYGQEAELAKKAGLDFKGLEVRGLVGRGLRSFSAAFAMLKAILQAMKILSEFQPQVVAGFGGYAAFAPLLAAKILNIPCLLHEQNAIAGLANRLLAKYCAKKICTSWQETTGLPLDKSVLTGNPVRANIANLGQIKRTFANKHLLIMGGSLGATAINHYIAKQLPLLHAAKIEIKIQSGKADLAMLQKACQEANYEADIVQPFIDDMQAVYTWADLVLCRAGATSVAELCAAGLPAILVPFPHATHDHQTYNAKSLERSGAAFCIDQDQLEHSATLDLILCLLNDPERLANMASKALALARPDAANAVLNEMTSIAK